MSHKATKDTKFRKLCFNGHPKYTSTNVHKTHTVFVFFFIFQFFFNFYIKNKINKTENKQKHVKQSKAKN